MSDDDKTPPSGFNWGLRPSGQQPQNEKPEIKATDDAEAAGNPVEPEPAPPLDLGHFLALNQTEMIAQAIQPGTKNSNHSGLVTR